jgi:hypothetical protein
MKSESALGSVPMNIEDLEHDVALGGVIGLKDISIPYLYVLQTNSPQCNEDNAKHVEGAKAGMLILTVKNEVYDGRVDGLTIVPCFYERKIMRWVDRDKGGGLVGSYPAEDPIMKQAKQNERGQWIMPNGDQLIDTAYHFLLVQNPKTLGWTQAIFPMKSTALKVSRAWNSQVATTLIPNSNKPAPRFLFKYNLSTVKEQKDTNVWSSPKILQLDMVTKEIYDQAKDFAKIAAQNLLMRAPESTDAAIDDSVPF